MLNYCILSWWKIIPTKNHSSNKIKQKKMADICPEYLMSSYAEYTDKYSGQFLTNQKSWQSGSCQFLPLSTCDFLDVYFLSVLSLSCPWHFFSATNAEKKNYIRWTVHWFSWIQLRFGLFVKHISLFLVSKDYLSSWRYWQKQIYVLMMMTKIFKSYNYLP